MASSDTMIAGVTEFAIGFLMLLGINLVINLVIFLMRSLATYQPTTKKSDDEVGTGFHNLDIIQKSIHALYQRLGVQQLRLYKESISLDCLLPRDESDPSLQVQVMAKALAYFLNLHVGTIIVTFRGGMEVPGRIQFTGDDHFFVEIDTKYRHQDEDVAAILAHEVTHIFLARLGLRFSIPEENEILTDTVAAYLGIGWIALARSAVEQRHAFGDTVHVTQRHFGYLTQDEAGYVLAKRAQVFDESPEKWLTTPNAQRALRNGSERARLDTSHPPLSDGDFSARREYAKRRRRAQRSEAPVFRHDFRYYVFEKMGEGPLQVAFRCPTCFQRLRVPVMDRTLTARCPLCASTIECRP
jgi:hypothetical protein